MSRKGSDNLITPKRSLHVNDSARPLKLRTVLVAVTMFVAGLSLGWRTRQALLPSAVVTTKPLEYTVDQLMALTDAELEKVDPLIVNLTVARGIPEFEKLDVKRYVEVVDGWAKEIQFDIDRHRYRFEQDPAQFNHSEPQYKIEWLISDIYTVFKIDYDILDFDFSDASNLFLNGIVDRRLGTCVSLPMLHVAIGWRLGMPINPVTVPTHVFARYDDGKDRINIEATGYGDQKPDAFYEERYFISQRCKERGAEMASLTPRQTLAIVLLARASYWKAVGNAEKYLEDALRANILYPAYPLAITDLVAAWNARATKDDYSSHALDHLAEATRKIDERLVAESGRSIEKLIFGEDGNPSRIHIDSANGKTKLVGN